MKVLLFGFAVFSLFAAAAIHSLFVATALRKARPGTPIGQDYRKIRQELREYCAIQEASGRSAVWARLELVAWAAGFSLILAVFTLELAIGAV